MQRRTLVLGIAAICASPLSAAQQRAKTPRVAVMVTQPIASPFVDAFRKGMRDLGYVEGQNIHIEYRSVDGASHRLVEVAAELVRLHPDVIVAGGGGNGIRAAKRATSTIPIISPASSDPVAFGHVASYARPGGNVTGLSIAEVDTAPKRVQLLKELLPRAKRVAVLRETGELTSHVQADATLAAARSMGLEPHLIGAEKPEQYEAALDSAVKARVDALLVLPSASFGSHRQLLVKIAARKKLITVWENRIFAESGGLISYGPDLSDMYRRAATYVDRVLKGANPAEMPIEHPIKFELVVNLGAAKALNIAIPPVLLIRADHVIQ